MTNSPPDVDRIWEAMLDDPAPPLPAAHEVLTVARTTARRRAAWAVAGSGIAGAVVIASVAAGVAFVGDPRAAPAPPAEVAGSPALTQQAPPPPQPPPLLTAPSQDAAHAHGTQNGAILMAAVPPGLTGVLQQSAIGSDSPAATWQVENGAEYASTVDVVLTNGHADGAVSVTIHGGLTGLGEDVCAKVVSDLVSVSAPGCEIVNVGGVPIRVFSTHDADRGDVTMAVRLLDGGLLYVEAQQGIPAFHAGSEVPPDGSVHTPDGKHTMLGGWPALPAVPFAKSALATIAANPALLPS